MKYAPGARRILDSGILPLLLLLPRPVEAQADRDPVVLGTYRVLHSRILEEDRVLQVHLPRDYESETLAYPVVFVFYSDWVEGYFTQLVNDLYHLSMDRMPRTILVGVRNTQRYRDLLPWPRRGGQPEEGRADRFLQFVREELIPFVEREYRTKPFRVLVGPQAAAVFGIYALLEAPGTFQAFILNDPCLVDHPGRSLCRELVAFAGTPAARGTSFAISHDAAPGSAAGERLDSLRAGLQREASAGFHWRMDAESAWPFFLPPVKASEALMDFFADYPLPAPAEATSLTDIQAHYDSVSARLGVALEPPDLALTLAGNAMMERGAYREALEVMNRLATLYPASMNGVWGLANLHRVMGDTTTALRYYEECLRRDPNMTPARDWIRRLSGG